jgi:hypothetical protein
MDIITARAVPATAAPPLTDAMRAHLLAQYRHDLRRDEAAAEVLRAAGWRSSLRDPAGARLRAVLLRAVQIRTEIAELDAAATRADLAELRGRA